VPVDDTDAPASTTDDLLTVPEAARSLNVSGRTVYRMTADKQLPAVHVRGVLRVRRGAVNDFIADQESRDPEVAR
jgi:excisionase family DNA binding protein